MVDEQVEHSTRRRIRRRRADAEEPVAPADGTAPAAVLAGAPPASDADKPEAGRSQGAAGATPEPTPSLLARASRSDPSADLNERPGRASRPERPDGGRRRDASERGLRGLVAAGPSQVSVTNAMRARDAARPQPADLAAAEREVVLIRRYYIPPDVHEQPADSPRPGPGDQSPG